MRWVYEQMAPSESLSSAVENSTKDGKYLGGKDRK